MKNSGKIVSFFIITLCLSCNNQNYEIKKESDILKDLLSQLITDERFYPLTPPPPVRQSDTVTDNGESILRPEESYTLEYDKFTEKLDPNRFVISIEDSTMSIKDPVKIAKKLKESGYDDLIDLLNNDDSNVQLPIDTSQIKKIDRYEFIIRSKVFSKGFDFGRYKGLDLTYYYFGNMSFSRPYLDATEEYGFVIYKRECGLECDRDDILIIQKQRKKWQIIHEISAL